MDELEESEMEKKRKCRVVVSNTHATLNRNNIYIYKKKLAANFVQEHCKTTVRL